MISHQLKGFMVSGLLHGSLLAALLLSTPWGPPPTPPLRIDFSISTASPAPPSAPPPPVAPQEVAPSPPPLKEIAIQPPKARIAAVQPKVALPPEEPPEPQRVVAEPPPVAPVIPVESSEPEPSPEPPTQSTIAAAVVHPTVPSVTGPVATTAEPGSPGRATAAQEYIKAHFLYIKEDIQQNFLPPRMARRMGWEGRVVVSFLIHEDGTVDQIKVVESSGFALLDQNAVESIRKRAPFPQPPVRAELVVPISYRLG